MTKVVIIEDEPLVAELLQQLLGHVAPEMEVVATLQGLRQSARWLQHNPMPDLFFMDIQLSDGVIFDLFEKFEITCPVIFTTAYSEYAIRAFRVNSVDYLLKPVDKAALQQALQKLKNYSGRYYPFPVQEIQQSLSNQQQIPYKEKFLVSFRHQLIPLPAERITFFHKDILIYATTPEEKYIMEYDSLDELEDLLNPVQFFRANRQYIININAIHYIEPHPTGKLTVVMQQKEKIDVSREKAPQFKKWLGA